MLNGATCLIVHKIKSSHSNTTIIYEYSVDILCAVKETSNQLFSVSSSLAVHPANVQTTMHHSLCCESVEKF